MKRAQFLLGNKLQLSITMNLPFKVKCVMNDAHLTTYIIFNINYPL